VGKCGRGFRDSNRNGYDNTMQRSDIELKDIAEVKTVILKRLAIRFMNNDGYIGWTLDEKKAAEDSWK
jgi:hypothetical protein